MARPIGSSSSSSSVNARSSSTFPMLHVRDAHDAQVLLEAVRLNMLPLIRRRLGVAERQCLRSGNVYVWEEAEDEGGLLRWTDGRRWSQSRMRGDYLFYDEKVETTQAERDAKAVRRARRATDPTAVLPPPPRRKDRPSKPNGLTKQTYSALVHVPGSSRTRKWHVVAYFSGDDYLQYPVIEEVSFLKNVVVPDGVYFNTKSSPVASPQARIRRSVSPAYTTASDGEVSSVPVSPLLLPSLPQPITFPATEHSEPRMKLPPLSMVVGTRPYLDPSQRMRRSVTQVEDRRVLDRFRISF